MVHFDLRRFYIPSRTALFGLALILGCCFTGCSHGSTSDFVKKQQAEEKAIAVLTNLGAKIRKADTGVGLSQGWVVDLSQVPFTSEITSQLTLMGYSIRVLNLSKTSIDDKQLADLIDRQTLRPVAELDLSHNSSITDQSIDKIATLFNLRDLNLVGTQVTEVGIARLQAQRTPLEIPEDLNEKNETERDNNQAPKREKIELKVHH